MEGLKVTEIFSNALDQVYTLFDVIKDRHKSDFEKIKLAQSINQYFNSSSSNTKPDIMTILKPMIEFGDKIVNPYDEKEDSSFNHLKDIYNIINTIYTEASYYCNNNIKLHTFNQIYFKLHDKEHGYTPYDITVLLQHYVSSEESHDSSILNHDDIIELRRLIILMDENKFPNYTN